jgi:NAD(P)H dehydrogenase (quinone)
MKHLIVYAHPNPASFCAAVRDTLVSSLREKGDSVEVRDLYESRYNPVLSAADLVGVQSGTPSVDVVTEQEAIRKADVIHLVFPTWWVGLPAILKGWVDRTFTYGFAFTVTDKGLKGLLEGKKVQLWQTVGHPEGAYAANGKTEAMLRTIDSGIFEFSGIQVAGHRFFWAVPYVDDATRAGYLARIPEWVQGE